jgi:maltose alpha-D-glucosyltransferase / alpha-amylase
MLRSYHYASVIALEERVASRIPVVADEDSPLRRWARMWRVWMGGSFLSGYLETARSSIFLADARDEEIVALLDIHRLEKSIYELLYELNSRPQYVRIPLAGIRQIWAKNKD